MPCTIIQAVETAVLHIQFIFNTYRRAIARRIFLLRLRFSPVFTNCKIKRRQNRFNEIMARQRQTDFLLLLKLKKYKSFWSKAKLSVTEYLTHSINFNEASQLILYSNIIIIINHSSLCFWCDPAVPSALPAPRWYPCRSAPSRWRCAGFARCSGWRCSETLCPGAAGLSETAGVSV